MLGKVAGGLLVGFVLYYLISNSYSTGRDTETVTGMGTTIAVI